MIMMRCALWAHWEESNPLSAFELLSFRNRSRRRAHVHEVRRNMRSRTPCRRRTAILSESQPRAWRITSIEAGTRLQQDRQNATSKQLSPAQVTSTNTAEEIMRAATSEHVKDDQDHANDSSLPSLLLLGLRALLGKRAADSGAALIRLWPRTWEPGRTWRTSACKRTGV